MRLFCIFRLTSPYLLAPCKYLRLSAALLPQTDHQQPWPSPVCPVPLSPAPPACAPQQPAPPPAHPCGLRPCGPAWRCSCGVFPLTRACSRRRCTLLSSLCFSCCAVIAALLRQQAAESCRRMGPSFTDVQQSRTVLAACMLWCTHTAAAASAVHTAAATHCCCHAAVVCLPLPQNPYDVPQTGRKAPMSEDKHADTPGQM